MKPFLHPEHDCWVAAGDNHLPFYGCLKHVAPVPDPPSVSIQEVVSRKIKRLRAKLGITQADLLPPVLAEKAEPCRGGGERHCTSNGATAEPQDSAEADLWQWRREIEDTLEVLRTEDDSRFPLVGLRQKVIRDGLPGSRVPDRP